MSAPDPIQEAVAHFRDDADFNRSWADGRRGHIQPTNADYIARRLEVAAQRECWADAIEAREAKIERLTIALNEARYRPMGDNHHNAILCPYCNPKGLRFTNPSEAPDNVES